MMVKVKVLPSKVEALMAWYSVFCTLVDADKDPHADKISDDMKLADNVRKLRQTMIEEAPDLERAVRQRAERRERDTREREAAN